MLVALGSPAAAQAPATPQPTFKRGVAVPLHSADPDFDYGPLIAELPALGATHVSLFVKLFQEHGA